MIIKVPFEDINALLEADKAREDGWGDSANMLVIQTDDAGEVVHLGLGAYRTGPVVMPEVEPLICPKCYREILPGTDVVLITQDYDPRVLAPGEVIMAHAVCPES